MRIAPCSARWLAPLALSLALAACDPEPEADAGTDAGPMAETDAGFDAGAPQVDAGPGCLGPPGLYEDGACEVIAAGVRAYTPRYSLWADDADKERYVYLPPGTTIDATDPDNWVFPVGTILYKTFLLDGRRLETRLLEKTDPGTGLRVWDMTVYAWNMEQTAVEDVTDAPLDRRSDVLGTDHDIPDGALCVQCHNGTLDLVNGFSAIMLNHDGAGVTLQTLLDESLLDPPFARSVADVPGDADQQEALGYLHANCGNCHHAPIPSRGACSTPACNSGFHLWLDTGTATVEATHTYVTGVNRIGTFTQPTANAYCRIHPGSPDTSTAVLRMESRAMGIRMPPIASERAHVAGGQLIRSFVSALTEAPSASCSP